MLTRSPLEDWQPKEPVEPQKDQTAQPAADSAEPAPQPEPSPEPAPAVNEPSTQPSAGVIDDSSLKNDGGQPEPASPPGKKVSFSTKKDTEPVQSELSDEGVLNFLSERLGRKVEAFDDLTSSEFASEQVQKINEFIKNTGRGVEDWIKTQSQNFQEMSDQEVIMQNMMLNDGLTRAEAERLYTHKYKQDPDTFSDDEIEIGKIELRRDARLAKDSLTSMQEQYASENVAPVQYKEKSLTETYFGSDEQFDDAFNRSLSEITHVVLGEGDDKFEWAVTEDMKHQYADSFESFDNILDEYRNEDGSFNTDKFIMHQLALRNFDAIVQARATTAKGQGKEEVIKDLKNTTAGQPTRQPGAADGTQGPSAYQQWVEANR